MFVYQYCHFRGFLSFVKLLVQVTFFCFLFMVNMCLFLLTGHLKRRSGTCLPCRWSVLLSLSPRIIRHGFRGSGPHCHLHYIHAGILCLLLENLDWSIWIISQRCKKIRLLLIDCNQVTLMTKSIRLLHKRASDVLFLLFRLPNSWRNSRWLWGDTEKPLWFMNSTGTACMSYWIRRWTTFSLLTNESIFESLF